MAGSEPPARRGVESRATERDAWIALSLVPGLGPAGFAQLVRFHGSAAAAWAAGGIGLRAATGLPGRVADALDERRRSDPRRLSAQATRAVAAVGRA